LYIELEELDNYKSDNLNPLIDHKSKFKWNLVSRWIKYEQHIDPETNIWSKPFVSPVIQQNLLYLKSHLQCGTIILNSTHDSIEGVVDDILDDFIHREHMKGDKRIPLRDIILSRNQSSDEKHLNKKESINNLFSSTHHHHNHNHHNTRRTGSRLSNNLNIDNMNTGNSVSNFRPAFMQSVSLVENRNTLDNLNQSEILKLGQSVIIIRTETKNFFYLINFCFFFE
jgi:hypothetical protein